MEIQLDDLEFLLFDWLEIDVDRDAMSEVFAQAQRLGRDRLATHAARSDANEPTLMDGHVVLIPEIKQALDALKDGGYFALGAAPDDGGLGLPQTVVSAVLAIFSAHNAPTYAYAMLTVAAANLLAAHGSESLKQRYLGPMLRGEYFGTMCLSEPHAGSSVGDLRTSAEAQADGSFLLRGTKMWISGGEHELADNICHFVLAKVPGGPPGTRGISLFLVPRLLDDGARNGIHVVGLNHKLGYRGTVNCLLNLGEQGPCRGFLVGTLHGGMRAMFTMMNEARIGVGTGAAAMGYAGAELALGYARERRQGRLPQTADPTSAPVPLIAHADVRRMLIEAKAYAEGALALCLYASQLLDEERRGSESAATLLALLTPIVKAWPSDYALKANDLAIQVLGGAGYTRDFAAERLWRDNRLNAIHEGTNGIQAIDLLGRKIVGDQGQALKILLGRMQDTVSRVAHDPALSRLGSELVTLSQELKRAVEPLILRAAFAELELVLSNASALLDALGRIVVAWLWLDQAHSAKRRIDAGDMRPLLASKCAACAWYFRWGLLGVRESLALVGRPDDYVYALSAESL
jgi:alkylation response protein AidB-like acyl-CoA dehydrogenase